MNLGTLLPSNSRVNQKRRLNTKLLRLKEAIIKYCGCHTLAKPLRGFVSWKYDWLHPSFESYEPSPPPPQGVAFLFTSHLSCLSSCCLRAQTRELCTLQVRINFIKITETAYCMESTR